MQIARAVELTLQLVTFDLQLALKIRQRNFSLLKVLVCGSGLVLELQIFAFNITGINVVATSAKWPDYKEVNINIRREALEIMLHSVRACIRARQIFKLLIDGHQTTNIIKSNSQEI